MIPLRAKVNLDNAPSYKKNKKQLHAGKYGKVKCSFVNYFPLVTEPVVSTLWNKIIQGSTGNHANLDLVHTEVFSAEATFKRKIVLHE